MTADQKFKLVTWCMPCRKEIDVSLTYDLTVPEPAHGEWVDTHAGLDFYIDCPDCDRQIQVSLPIGNLRIAEV